MFFLNKYFIPHFLWSFLVYMTRIYCDLVTSVKFDDSIEFKLEIHQFSRKLEKLWFPDMLSAPRPSSEVVIEGRILKKSKYLQRQFVSVFFSASLFPGLYHL